MDLFDRILELSRCGYFCGQILAILMLGLIIFCDVYYSGLITTALTRADNPIKLDSSTIYIAKALSPAKVLMVYINEDEKAARVIVPDNQLSLAIGKEGQNARLAAKLTGWKIDIKSQSQAENAMGGAEA